MQEINQALHNVNIQINEAQQRIDDLTAMLQEKQITGKHIFLAQAEIRACGKRILTLRIARNMIKRASA